MKSQPKDSHWPPENVRDVLTKAERAKLASKAPPGKFNQIALALLAAKKGSR